jgi:hypothetical protein
MFSLTSISDDEIEFFDQSGDDSSEKSLLDYLQQVELPKVESSRFEIPDFDYNFKRKITANIATHPPRFESLLVTLDSIEGQFDEIRIYLNGYKSVPEELKKYTTHIGYNITDNGKFFWSGNKNEYYFTLDDDIVYPDDYVKRTIPLIKDRIVTYHGRRLINSNINYYDNHKLWAYYHKVESEKILDVAGTGVMAFNTNIFSPNLWKSSNHKITDLLISLEAHLFKIPIICLPKPSNWFDGTGFDFDSIYLEYKGREEKQIKFANMIREITGSKIEMSRLNYQFTENSLKLLSEFIYNKTGDFLLIRTGNGHLIESISKSSNFERFSAIDTDSKRIYNCKSSYTNSKVEYNYITNYQNIKLESETFIFLDDFMLPKNLSTKIWQLIPEGSSIICHNIIDGVFPLSKVVLKVEDGDDLLYYYYIK